MTDHSTTILTGILALLFAGLGYPLARGKVPPNCWYGYRLNRPTMENEDIWYAVNRAGGWHMFYLGCFMALMTLVSLFWQGKEGPQGILGLITLGIAIVWTTVSIFYTYRLSLRMARGKGLR